MDITFSFSDEIFKKFKREDSYWTATVDCAVTIGARSIRVRAIREALSRSEARKRRTKHIRTLELSTRIANSYARVFSGRKAFGPMNEREQNHFDHTARKILILQEKTNLDEQQLIKELICCLSREYYEHGKTVKIGYLCSDHTWNVLFPQHLRQCIPGYKEG